jgi:thioesterase domain-containing protein/acyl carrier protein
LVRLRVDGLVDLVGRTDRQLKIRGFRVDPGDVEATLCGCDEVAEAVVIAERVDGKDALVAYVVPRAPTHASIRATLNNIVKGLPDHMRPTSLRIIDAIPRLPSFKPDVKALERLEDAAFTEPLSLTRPREAPATELEAAILTIWQKALKVDNLGVTDNFFDAGGDSLSAMKVTLEIESQLDLEITLEQIFTSPTVRALCTHAGESNEREPAVILPMRSGQAQGTLYFTHGGFVFSPLSNALNSGISTAFVTMNGARWLNRLVVGRDILDAIDGISRAYAHAIFARHRAGPFYLAGHSFGGILAIETASKLEELGAEPGTVFLFDTYLHGSLHRILYNIRHNRWLYQKMQQFRQGNKRETIRRALFLTRNAFRRSTQSTILENPLVDAEEDLRCLFRDLREEASQAYRGPTGVLASDVVLFRATESVAGRMLKYDPDLGWARSLRANLTIIQTPGNHYSLLAGRHASYVAKKIDDIINL